MRRFHGSLLIATAALACVASGPAQTACPTLPGAAGDVVRVGDWGLVDGVRLVTCGDGAVLTVACGDGDAPFEVRLTLPSPLSGTHTVRMAGAGGATLVTTAMVSDGDAIVWRGADAARLIPLVAAADVLQVAVTPADGATAARQLAFATAGLAEALPWLACGGADACPTRSCDR
jgi:hypothetical protein